MNIILWILQVLLGIYFLFVGVNHFIVPPGLPGAMSWMYELPTGIHYFSGTAEILAALAGFVTYGRWRLSPLPNRSASPNT